MRLSVYAGYEEAKHFPRSVTWAGDAWGGLRKGVVNTSFNRLRELRDNRTTKIPSVSFNNVTNNSVSPRLICDNLQVSPIIRPNALLCRKLCYANSVCSILFIDEVLRTFIPQSECRMWYFWRLDIIIAMTRSVSRTKYLACLSSDR